MTMSTKIALFKAGEISQVAAPMDLYMNPIDLQAADFIGNPRINFLQGRARREGSKMYVSCELDSYVFDEDDFTGETIPEGEFDCVVAIRPEQINIFTEPAEGRIPVQVYANQPAGSETLVSLKKGDSSFLSKQIGLEHYKLDQEVYVSVSPEKINVYNAETTRLIKRAR